MPTFGVAKEFILLICPLLLPLLSLLSITRSRKSHMRSMSLLAEVAEAQIANPSDIYYN